MAQFLASTKAHVYIAGLLFVLSIWAGEMQAGIASLLLLCGSIGFAIAAARRRWRKRQPAITEV